MGDIKNVYNTEAIEKIKELAKDNICLFCTKIETGKPFSTRPMGAQQIDDAGNIWFLSDKDSTKNMEIKDDDKVQLLFSKPNHTDYLSVWGSATILYDKQKIKELFEPIAKAWFKEGEDDPSISVIRVMPEEGYYWNSKYGKIVTLAKIVVSAFSKKADEASVEGEIKL